jgi:hypothetical protein
VKQQSLINSTSGIVLFYPNRLLTNQVFDWADRHGGCKTSVAFERTLPGIRKCLRRCELAVINATDDPSQASDAFLQAVSILKCDSVAVYTEKMHEGLELFVRTLGAPLLLGPMNFEEVEDYLEHKFPSLIPLVSAGASEQFGNRVNAREYAENEDGNIVYYKPIAG